MGTGELMLVARVILRWTISHSMGGEGGWGEGKKYSQSLYATEAI